MVRHLVLSVLTGMAVLVAGPGQVCAEVLTHRVRDDQEPIAVQPLDDPANPYRGLYREWDHWIYDNAAAPDAYWITGPDLDNINTGIDTYVDANGYMLPLMESVSLWFDFVATGKRDMEPFPYQVYAYGLLPADLAQLIRAERDRLWTPYLPPVPGWLVTLSPWWSIILPDGHVVVSDRSQQGWTQDGFIDASMDSHGKYDDSGWILCDASGSELGRVGPGHSWFELTFPDFPSIYAGFLKDNGYAFFVHKYGFVHIYDGNRQDGVQGSRGSYAWFDYDGTPLPANSLMRDDLMTRRNGNAFLGIHGYDLPLIYAAQQELAAAQSGMAAGGQASKPGS